MSGGTPGRPRLEGAFQHMPGLDVPVECDPFAGPIGPAAHADFYAVGPPAPETEIDGDVDAVVLSVLPADVSLEHRRNGLDAPIGQPLPEIPPVPDGGENGGKQEAAQGD